MVRSISTRADLVKQLRESKSGVSREYLADNGLVSMEAVKAALTGAGYRLKIEGDRLILISLPQVVAKANKQKWQPLFEQEPPPKPRGAYDPED